MLPVATARSVRPGRRWTMPRKKKTRPKKTRIPGIMQIDSGKFLVRVRKTDKRTGRRRKIERMVETFPKAVALQEKLKAGDTLGGRRTRERFGDYAEGWIELRASRLAPSTKQTYVTNLARAVEAFGSFYLDGLQPSDVRSWQARCVGKFGAVTLNNWLRLLRQVLDDAVADGILKSNPAKAIKALPEGRTGGRRGTALSLEEFRRFLGVVERMAGSGELSGDLGRLVVVLAWTGLRIGEGLALKWTDLVEGEVYVRRSVWRGIEKSTKTGEIRRVAVVEPVAVALSEQRRWLVATQHPGLASALVFPADRSHALGGARRRGGEVSWYRAPSCLQKPLRKIAAAARAPEVSPHSLRRTFENLTRLAGVDGMVRRAVAGWRSEEVQGIYAGVGREEREAAGAAMLRLVEEDGK
jgi:integrase